jgi:hypothetical protein
MQPRLSGSLAPEAIAMRECGGVCILRDVGGKRRVVDDPERKAVRHLVAALVERSEVLDLGLECHRLSSRRSTAPPVTS